MCFLSVAACYAYKGHLAQRIAQKTALTEHQDTAKWGTVQAIMFPVPVTKVTDWKTQLANTEKSWFAWCKSPSTRLPLAQKSENIQRAFTKINSRHKHEKEWPCGVTALTISETAQAVERGHFDDKGEDVIDESVERFVGQHAPWEVGHRLQFVVDEQLRRHHDEAWNIQPHFSLQLMKDAGIIWNTLVP